MRLHTQLTPEQEAARIREIGEDIFRSLTNSPDQQPEYVNHIANAEGGYFVRGTPVIVFRIDLENTAGKRCYFGYFVRKNGAVIEIELQDGNVLQFANSARMKWIINPVDGFMKFAPTHDPYIGIPRPPLTLHDDNL